MRLLCGKYLIFFAKRTVIWCVFSVEYVRREYVVWVQRGSRCAEDSTGSLQGSVTKDFI